MSRQFDHEIHICRALYQLRRQKGAPVIHICRLAADFMVAESADGKMRMELKSECCAWSAKAELAERWLDEHQRK